MEREWRGKIWYRVLGIKKSIIMFPIAGEMQIPANRFQRSPLYPSLEKEKYWLKEKPKKLIKLKGDPPLKTINTSNIWYGVDKNTYPWLHLLDRWMDEAYPDTSMRIQSDYRRTAHRMQHMPHTMMCLYCSDKWRHKEYRSNCMRIRWKSRCSRTAHRMQHIPCTMMCLYCLDKWRHKEYQSNCMWIKSSCSRSAHRMQHRPHTIPCSYCLDKWRDKAYPGKCTQIHWKWRCSRTAHRIRRILRTNYY